MTAPIQESFDAWKSSQEGSQVQIRTGQMGVSEPRQRGRLSSGPPGVFVCVSDHTRSPPGEALTVAGGQASQHHPMPRFASQTTQESCLCERE